MSVKQPSAVWLSRCACRVGSSNALFSLGWGVSVTFLKYGPQFFKQRRILQQYLAKPEVVRFRPIHTTEARKMLQHLVERPADFDWLVRRYVLPP